MARSLARTGFVEDADYARLTANAGELWLRLFLELAYTYGWRKAELLGLRVRQCDLIATSIRLEAQSKNGQAFSHAPRKNIRKRSHASSRIMVRSSLRATSRSSFASRA